MSAILRGREFLGALLLVGLMIVFFVLACESPSTTMTDFETPSSGNTPKTRNTAHVSSSSVVPTAGGVDAWVYLYLGWGDPEWAIDYVTVQTTPMATNVRYKVSIYSSIPPCDPLGYAEKFVRIDNSFSEFYSTGWKSLSPGYHNFLIYERIRHSTGMTDCLACYPPPGECVAEVQTTLNVRWDSAQE